MISLALASVAIVLIASMIGIAISVSKRLGEAEARLEREEQNRVLKEKMASEMLKERSVEDVARDLDAGQF